MSQEYDIHATLQKIPFIRVEVLEQWDNAARRSFDTPEDILARKAADRTAHEFARSIYAKNKFKYSKDPEGLRVRLETYAFTYEELLELATKLYGLGQKDGMSRNLNFTVQDHTK